MATVHHVDLNEALNRLRALLRPGGVLVLVGLAADQSAIEIAQALLQLGPVRVLDLLHHRPPRLPRSPSEGRDSRGPGVVVRAPDLSWSQTRRILRDELPGVEYRRRLYWRYAAMWRSP